MAQQETVAQRMARFQEDSKKRQVEEEQPEPQYFNEEGDPKYTRKPGRKGNRWTIRRRIDEGMLNLDRAMEYFTEAGFFFDGVHADYFEAFYHIVASIEQIKSNVAELKELI